MLEKKTISLQIQNITLNIYNYTLRHYVAQNYKYMYI